VASSGTSGDRGQHTRGRRDPVLAVAGGGVIGEPAPAIGTAIDGDGIADGGTNRVAGEVADLALRIASLALPAPQQLGQIASASTAIGCSCFEVRFGLVFWPIGAESNAIWKVGVSSVVISSSTVPCSTTGRFRR
jgi:hypothetical protein